MWRAAVVLAVLVGCRGSTAKGPEPVTATAVQPAAPVEPVAVTPPVEPVAATPVVPEVEPSPVTATPQEPAKVQVHFTMKPEVGEGPPVLTITVSNPSAVAVPMTRFDDVRCVAQHYLRLKVVLASGKQQAWRACAVKDWPGREEPLAAGGELALQVPLAELAASWPRGRYEVDVSWDPSELVRARGEAAAVRASQSSQNFSEFFIARPLATVKVMRGATVTLPDGVQVRFAGHSHKDVGPGQRSPLIVRGSLTRAGAARGEEFSLNLQTEETRVFWLEERLAFELVDHAYDEWMRLRYYGKQRRG
jgi:hypothetical protein